MLSPLVTVLPIFALVLAGWAARRIGVLGPQATTELNRFVVHLALPALLFDITAHARWAEIWQPGFVAAFGVGMGSVFALTVAVQRHRVPSLAEATIDGLNASYANTGFIGFPLVLVTLGPEAMAPTLIAAILTVCVLFGVAIALIESDLQAGARRGRVAAKVGLSLLRNPLLVAPALGALVPLSGLALPHPAETFLDLLGGAASPCALVALGLFLAAPREAGPRTPPRVIPLVASKLLLQPAVTWVLAVLVFDLPPPLVQAAVLLAALPTGTGPFMLAELYGRGASITAGVVLVSTIGSVLTITGYLAVIG